MKGAISGKNLGHALPCIWNSSINYFHPVCVNAEVCVKKSGFYFPVGLISIFFLVYGNFVFYSLLRMICHEVLLFAIVVKENTTRWGKRN